MEFHLFSSNQIYRSNNINSQDDFKNYWYDHHPHQLILSSTTNDTSCTCETCLGIQLNNPWSLQDAVGYSTSESQTAAQLEFTSTNNFTGSTPTMDRGEWHQTEITESKKHEKHYTPNTLGIQQNIRLTTSFEDLSNEILYEIFDFLDGYNIYETFSKLNARFECLITNSSHLLKFNFSIVSKTTFAHRLAHIVIPNTHRIVSLSLSNPFIIDYFLDLCSIDFSFIRLEALSLHGIESQRLVYLLTTLTSAPCLHSLSLTVLDAISDLDCVYRLILRRSALKYAKLSFEQGGQNSLAIRTANEQEPTSNIEYLIIDNFVDGDDLIALLSYTPKLRRLSCFNDLFIRLKQPKLSFVSPSLTHVNLYTTDEFDYFETFLLNICFHLQVLRVSHHGMMDILDANRWQQMIENSMSHLKRFELLSDTDLGDDDSYQDYYHTLIEKFTAPFWVERQWFFAHQHYRKFGVRAIFYSIGSFRWNHYELRELQDNDICPRYDNHLSLARVVTIEGNRAAAHCSIKFPRATELALTLCGDGEHLSSIGDLSRMIPLEQLTRIGFYWEHVGITHLLELLHLAPNVHSLSLLSDQWFGGIGRNFVTEHNVIGNNKIRKVSVDTEDLDLTLEEIQLLMRMCPCVQYLDLRIEKEQCVSIVEFLLLRNAANNNHIPITLMSFRPVFYEMDQEVRSMIDRDQRFCNYSIKNDRRKMYLWC
ncbi:unnamed protein product [Rotaria socialis]|uniref:F-box domain-containing protein n=1 Tax=Rotaria socialis TaxID=392032 RepID=A0A817Y2C2_9BILA|nr:unnamed protein product [Rotaria socialis]